MSPIYWPQSEVTADLIDRSREKFKALTSNIEGTLREPVLLAAARRRMAEQFDPIVGGLRESLNPVQGAGTLGRSLFSAAATEPAPNPLLEQARSRFDELTKPTVSGLSTALNPVQAAGTLGRAAVEPITTALAPVGSALDRFDAEQKAGLDDELARMRLPSETREQTIARNRNMLERGEAMAGGMRVTAAESAAPRFGRVMEGAQGIFDPKTGAGIGPRQAGQALRTFRGAAEEAADDLAAAAPRTRLREAADTFATMGRANLLSGPLTHIRNLTATATSVVTQPVERAVAALVQPGIEALGATPGAPRTLRQAGQMAASYRSNLPGALREAVEVLKKGDPALLAGQTGQRLAANPNAVERVSERVLRTLSAEDRFWQRLVSGAEEAAGATPQAAKAAATERTFNSALDRFGKEISRVQRVPVVGPVLLPFFRTSYNLAKWELAHSPLGAVDVLNTARRGGDSAVLADKTARALMGTALWGSLLKYGLDGDDAAPNLTGALPETQAERDAWQQEGVQPHSIKIGGSYFSYQGIPGLSSNLTALAGLAAEARSRKYRPDRGYVESAGRVAGSLAEQLIDRPLLGNLSDLVAAVHNPGASMGRFASQAAGTAAGMVIPGSGALGWAARSLDPAVREQPGTPGEALALRIPGMQGAAPEQRRTAFGDPLERTGSGIERALSPVRRQAATPEQARRRYVGSESAAMDAEITRAIDAFRNYRNHPDQYPPPTDRQEALFYTFRSQADRETEELAQAERVRRRRRVVDEAAEAAAVETAADRIRASFAAIGPPGRR